MTVKIKESKLLGGWLAVHGSHDTPISSVLPSKKEVKLWLEWREAERNRPWRERLAGPGPTFEEWKESHQ